MLLVGIEVIIEEIWLKSDLILYFTSSFTVSLITFISKSHVFFYLIILNNSILSIMNGWGISEMSLLLISTPSKKVASKNA